MSDDEKRVAIAEASGIERLIESMRIVEGLTSADNLKLVWLLNQSIHPLLVAEMQRDIWNEMENRLTPEYDGETYRITESGWITPNGEIKYV